MVVSLVDVIEVVGATVVVSLVDAIEVVGATVVRQWHVSNSLIFQRYLSVLFW